MAEITRESIDFTTNIGCRVNCIRYCPQEVIARKYKGNRVLKYEDYTRWLDKVPDDVLLLWGGISEPFLNPRCTDMILHGHKKGHTSWLFTTLVGAIVDDIRRIAQVPFERVVIHLPDSFGNAHIPQMDEYLKVLSAVMTSIPNIEYMSMAGGFKSEHIEDWHRGNPKLYRSGRLWCLKHGIPSPTVMPNGNVNFCCFNRGITGIIGHMDDMCFEDMRKLWPSFMVRAQAEDSLCRACPASENYYRHYTLQLVNKWLRRIGAERGI